MLWERISIPPSAAGLLDKARTPPRKMGKPISKVQVFVAAVHFFTLFPLEDRQIILNEYQLHRTAQVQPKVAAGLVAGKAGRAA